jgi:hypothetical protein
MFTNLFFSFPPSGSMKLHENFNDIFYRIVRAAEHPYLSIPKTEAGNEEPQALSQLINHFVKFV